MVACVVVVSAADASNRRRCCTHLTSSATTATAAAAAAASLCCGAASQLVLPSVGIGVVVGDSSSSAPPPPPPPHRRSSAQSSCGAGGNGDGDGISVVPTTNRVVYNSNCSTNSSSMMTPSATALLCHHHHGTAAAAAATDPAAGLGSGSGPSPSQSQSQSQGSGQNSNSSCCTCSTNPTTATTTTIECVDQLKQQIRRAIDNSQLDEANEVLSELEKCSITKEILEATRVGAVVNDIRKRMQETSPALSKRCRALIKCWQKLLSGDQRPTSSCGSTHSNSVTPNAALSSPVVRHRGLTPGTPKRGGRLASCTAFSTGSLSALTSPAVGVTTSPASSSSYAPHSGGTSQHRVSPRNGTTPGVSSANHMHKSYTNVDLLKKSLEENGDKLNKLLLAEKCNDLVKNGKRKLDEVQQSGVKVTALTNGLGGKDENAAISQKRVKISAAAAAGGSSSGGSSSKAGSRSGSGLGSSPLASFHVSGGGAGSSTSPDKTPSVSPPSKASSSSSHNGSGAHHHHNHAPATPTASAASSHAHQKTLSEARKANVQSTSDLVAELSENLPKYMAINLLERENQLRKEMQQQQHGADAAEMQQSSSSTQLHHAQHGHHGLGLHAAASSPSISSLDQQQQARKKETRGRPPKNKQQTVQTKSADTIKAEPLSEEGTANSQLSRIKEEESGEDKAHLIWTSMLPTLDNLRHREHFHATPSNDPSKSYIINARGRQVIALPYLDTGLPDFVEFNYPEAYKFYSEENFIYGADRPL